MKYVNNASVEFLSTDGAANYNTMSINEKTIFP